MRIRNMHLLRLKHGLRGLYQEEKNPNKREFIQGLMKDLELGVLTYERWLEAAKMIGYRNPSFDGDEVGYPEDDFDE